MFTMQSIHVSLLMWGCVFCVLAAVYISRCKGIYGADRHFLCSNLSSVAVLLLSNSLTWIVKGHAGTVEYYIIRISCFGVFFTTDLIVFLFNAYLCRLLFCKSGSSEKVTIKKMLFGTNEIPKRASIVYFITFSAMLLVVISQFTDLYYFIDENNLYRRSSAHIISVVLPIISLILDFSLIIQYRKRMKNVMFRAIIIYFILPVIGSVAQFFYYGISFINIGLAISSIYLFFTVAGNQDKEFSDMRISVMMSQIKPHFIYNTITAVQELCLENPEQAVKLIGDFSDYLRGNLNSLTITECISFNRELEHTKKYLAIEKERFGDRINVIYDIRELDFTLPALTLQPIVENSVKHGITKKKNGGTIRIQTYKKSDRYVIRVEDDGVGFSNVSADSEHEHVGIKNVRNRLREMCGGSLEIYSSDTGTIAEMRIPIK